MVLSSLEVRRDVSTMCGDGDNLVEGVPPPSDIDRAFGTDVLPNGVASTVSWSLTSSSMMVLKSPIVFRERSMIERWRLIGLVIVESKLEKPYRGLIRNSTVGNHGLHDNMGS